VASIRDNSGRGPGRDDEWLVAAQDEMLGDSQDAVGDAVHVGRERFGDDRDSHSYTVNWVSDAPGRNAMTRRRTVDDISDQAADPPG